MEMPTTLPKELNSYLEVETEELLLQALYKDDESLILFFTSALWDETWCEKHPGILTKIMETLNERLLDGKISLFLAKETASSIHRHFSTIESQIPKNIACQVQEALIPVNSFLFQAASPFFYNIIQRMYVKGSNNQFKLKEGSAFNFDLIVEYVYTGHLEYLWRLTSDEVVALLELAMLCELKSLVADCEKMLLKFVDGSNFIEFLTIADKHHLMGLKKKACDYFSHSQDFLVISIPESGDGLVCELLEVTETSLEVLSSLAAYVTHFIVGTKVSSDRRLIDLLHSFPQLVSLDLGKTQHENTAYYEFTGIRELILKEAVWVDDAHLTLFSSLYPNLERLDLTGCLKITSKGFGELINFPKLSALNLAMCDNLDDASLNLVLSSVRNLDELILNSCRYLTQNAFRDISKSQGISVLFLERTQLNDTSLLQITSQMKNLQVLSLKRCIHLTEGGVIKALKFSSSLVWVNLSELNLNDDFLGHLVSYRPEIVVLVN